MRIKAYINAGARSPDGLADIRIRFENETEYQLDLPVGDLYDRFGVPNASAMELLVTASTCYMVDKTVPRTIAADVWTRTLEVELPVADPPAWNKIAGDLAETLTFLTGDEWRLVFYKAPEALFEPPKLKSQYLLTNSGIKAVCLFSGGLDSLCGAIDLLSEVSEKILLIGHYDGSGPRKVQAYLASQLTKEYPNRFGIEHVRVAHRPQQAAEETLRSRSFVFVALGMFGAQSLGPAIPLYMFENGFIALNVPLTPSRRSSCSTRTMHPYFLDRLRSVLGALGISNPLINPYAFKTKGECIVECRNQALLVRLAEDSVSCSHASRRQDWLRRNAKNCGYCVPCMCRRAALFKAGLDDGKRYGRDVLTGELTPEDQRESANDLRAVTDFLRGPVTPAALRKRLLAVSPLPDLDAYSDLACRGFAEIKAWLTGMAKKAAAQ
ncbi:MAG: Qat anti-phage system QueC-like protein QatC [Terriglobales bacterium]